jgi:hypothetical protein
VGRRRTSPLGLLLEAVLLALLGACAPRPPPKRPAELVYPVPREGRTVLRSLSTLGTRRSRLYGVLDGESRILVRVRRGGPLAAFGHNHIVSSRVFTGLLRASPRPGAVFCLPLANLSVDRPALRRRAGAGFSGVLSPALRRATDRHMLESLHARRHPDLLVLVRPAADPSQSPAPWRLVVVLNGREMTVQDARLRVRETPARIFVRARFSILQRAFGVSPYSILGGALRVRNRLAVSVRVTATRLRTRVSLLGLERGWCARRPPHLGGEGR